MEKVRRDVRFFGQKANHLHATNREAAGEPIAPLI